MTQYLINKVGKWGEKPKNIGYGTNLAFINYTKEKFVWDIKDDLRSLIEYDQGFPPRLPAKFRGVLLEENISGRMETVKS